MEYATAIQKNPNAELCCWDDNEERGKATAEKLGVPFQPDLQAIWDDPTIEGISVTTATNQHTEVLIAAAKAKKNIFTEKVLTFTNEEAQEVAKAVKESGVKFTVSFPPQDLAHPEGCQGAGGQRQAGADHLHPGAQLPQRQRGSPARRLPGLAAPPISTTPPRPAAAL